MQWWGADGGAGGTQGLAVLKAAHSVCIRTLGVILGFFSAGRKPQRVPSTHEGAGATALLVNETVLGEILVAALGSCSCSRAVLAVQPRDTARSERWRGHLDGTGGTGTARGSGMSGMSPRCGRNAPESRGTQPHDPQSSFIAQARLVNRSLR